MTTPERERPADPKNPVFLRALAAPADPKNHVFLRAGAPVPLAQRRTGLTSVERPADPKNPVFLRALAAPLNPKNREFLRARAPVPPGPTENRFRLSALARFTGRNGPRRH